MSDGDCGPRLYCPESGRCEGQCIPGKASCPTGQLCGAHGRCILDPNAGCPRVDVVATPTIPTVALLLDQSGSMNDPFMGSSRWDAMKQALVDPASGVLPALESKVRFGATLYTSHDGGPTCPVLQEVAPALNNRAAIASLLAANQPDDDTPTGEAIRELSKGLSQSQTPIEGGPAGPTIIVLATDGDPDSCTDPDANGTMPPRDLSVQETKNAFAAGYRTYVLSVGSDVTKPHLQDLANAGAGVVAGGADAPYYVANNPGELVQAFNTIINGARSCTFKLNAQVELAAAPGGVVILNGTPLGYQDPNGWRMNDSTTIELLGDACQQFITSPTSTLQASFPCDTVIIL